MSSIPETSIVITCFNYGQYLEGCLNSALNQSYKNFEIIVVDDGSTDNTPIIMGKYAHIQNVQYIRQANRGQAIAKNTGIKHAKGKFIAFLDADDLWEDNKLEKQIELFSSNNVGVVYSRARYIDGEGKDLDFQIKGKYLQPKRGNVTNSLIMDNYIPFSSSVVRKECFEQLGGFDESLKMGIDWDLWLKISTKYEFDFVDQPLLIYRIGHAGQMSKNLEERQRCSDRIMNNFVSCYPAHVKKAQIKKAWAYTFLNRGAYHAEKNIKIALIFYCRSLIHYPFSIDPIKGMLKIARDKVFQSISK